MNQSTHSKVAYSTPWAFFQDPGDGELLFRKIRCAFKLPFKDTADESGSLEQDACPDNG
ncbi:MAG: hypothetical protein ACI9W2_002032 [Gammaproteobacteria bacterium]